MEGRRGEGVERWRWRCEGVRGEGKKGEGVER